MIKAERQIKITEMLQDEKRISVKALSKALGVSEVTIRIDLEQLENKGVLYRTHGGASLVPKKEESDKDQNQIQEMLFGEYLKYDEHKEHIGKLAAELVQEGEWIFIGQGSTCYFVAKELVAKDNLNVLTNNLCVAAVLAQNPKSKVVVTGGSLIHQHMFLAGDMLLRSLENIFISKAFMGVSGIDFKGGFTVSNDAELRVYDRIKNITQELIIVADTSKFGKPTFISIGELSMPDIVITDGKLETEYLECFSENKVKVLY